jgi:hypothetical protein
MHSLASRAFDHQAGSDRFSMHVIEDIFCTGQRPESIIT